MPRIANSIVIAAPKQMVFDITNDIERWPELFSEYRDSKILDASRSGRFTALTFELTNATATWKSWRLLDHENHFAIAERKVPLYPFVFMHLHWAYEQTTLGTEMTWTQDFELDPSVDRSLSDVVDGMQKHARQNQISIKNHIESLQASLA